MKLLDLLLNHVPRDRQMLLRVGRVQFDEWSAEVPPNHRFWRVTEPRTNLVFGPTLVVRDENLPPREYMLEETP